MRKFSLFLLIVFLGFSGCTRHYFRISNDSVNIFLEKPNAEQVYFFSSLDGYRPHKAHRVGSGRWQITVPANIEFKYFYNVDGNIYLPPCELKEYDDFGSKNCIYTPQM